MHLRRKLAAMTPEKIPESIRGINEHPQHHVQLSATKPIGTSHREKPKTCRSAHRVRTPGLDLSRMGHTSWSDLRHPAFEVGFYRSKLFVNGATNGSYYSTRGVLLVKLVGIELLVCR